MPQVEGNRKILVDGCSNQDLSSRNGRGMGKYDTRQRVVIKLQDFCRYGSLNGFSSKLAARQNSGRF